MTTVVELAQAVRGKARRWALNRADCLLGVFALLLLTIAVLLLLFKIDHPLFGPVLAGWAALFVAGISGVVRITSTRQSLNKLFSSEIRALQYGLSTIDMFRFWRELHTKPETGATGFADAPRQENYFQTFHSVSNNIGNLHPDAVEAVVRFYTYLKMSRDAAAALNSWEEEKDMRIRKMHAEYVIKLLAVSMLWGFVALWYMGARPVKQDIKFLEEIKQHYDGVVGKGEFEKLRSNHLRSSQLEQFERAAMAAPAPVQTPAQEEILAAKPPPPTHAINSSLPPEPARSSAPATLIVDLGGPRAGEEHRP
jgi:hypothetical protein